MLMYQPTYLSSIIDNLHDNSAGGLCSVSENIFVRIDQYFVFAVASYQFGCNTSHMKCDKKSFQNPGIFA